MMRYNYRLCLMSTSNQNFIWRQIFIKQITARCEKERERERERETRPRDEKLNPQLYVV